jgi:demethylmenaquinone methyltransferase/2-methoxy-6-polyprenyl-1,4-benzoquinol methylase
MSEEPRDHLLQSHADQLGKTNYLTASAIQQAVEALSLPRGSCGLDAGCGIGLDTIRLANAVAPGGKVTGLDRSRAMLDFATENARRSGLQDEIDFQEGNFLNLPFAEDSFDWVWCKDSLWPGFLQADPERGLKELARVVRPSGTVALLYWSSQTFLAGYPDLEARLAVAFSETAPYVKGVKPDHHYLRAMGWMQSVGLLDIQARCFAVQAHAPLDARTRDSIDCCLHMFFDDLQAHVTKEDWTLLQKLIRPDSSEYVLNRPDYYCFVTYSMFTGRASKK